MKTIEFENLLTLKIFTIMKLFNFKKQERTDQLLEKLVELTEVATAKKQQTKVDLQVETMMRDYLALMEKSSDATFFIKSMIERINERVDEVTADLLKKVEKCDVQYDWYGKLSNYSVTINLIDVQKFIKKEKLAEFNEVSQRYREAYLRRCTEKTEDSKIL